MYKIIAEIEKQDVCRVNGKYHVCPSNNWDRIIKAHNINYDIMFDFWSYALKITLDVDDEAHAVLVLGTDSTFSKFKE